jgi:hypothetical protein
MCGSKERSNQSQSSFKQQQQTYLNLSVKQHHKHNQINQDKKKNGKITHQFFLSSLDQFILHMGKAALQSIMIRVIQRGCKKSVSKFTKNKPLPIFQVTQTQ